MPSVELLVAKRLVSFRSNVGVPDTPVLIARISALKLDHSFSIITSPDSY